MLLKNITNLVVIILVGLAVVTTGCDNDDNDKDNEVNPKHHVNDWILSNMQYFYYWNAEMNVAADKNQTPDQYFSELLVDQDRFSWLQDNYEELINSLNGVTLEAGLEFVLYLEDEVTVIAQVTYVKPNSPASVQFSRGDVITHINFTPIKISNYYNLLAELNKPFSVLFHRYDALSGSFGAQTHASLVPVQYTENPNYMHTIIDKGNRKIGYFVYNFFGNGPTAESNQYNNEMDQIFAEFKSEAITDMVVDLRFNSGGSEQAANNLASLLKKGSPDAIFAKRKFNDALNDEIIKDPQRGSDYLVSKFSTKSANIGDQLTNSRVYILTTRNTASASELVINSLKPYMDVIIIGDTTYGKNVGSFSLYDENDPANTWGMQPIVLQMFNSRDESEYENGFVPDVTILDNDLLLRPLGDPEERLLSVAIEEITGIQSGGRIRAHEKIRKTIAHSISLKKRGFNLIVDQNDAIIEGLTKSKAAYDR